VKTMPCDYALLDGFAGVPPYNPCYTHRYTGWR